MPSLLSWDISGFGWSKREVEERKNFKNPRGRSAKLTIINRIKAMRPTTPPMTPPTIAPVSEKEEKEWEESEVMPKVIIAPEGQSSLPQSFEASSILQSYLTKSYLMKRKFEINGNW
ncbi:hypothetical protein K435DRAFT_809578 [Dendrothele bispora CBS 962.96]|uniref:Uncharacterized protein n=1 Tax=Dendrothele bispora (strain CBS 962.96) TaxID=1314807 RepID=A0A4S8KXU1_DENBC|nr:hypothetical protein K435DRAFT_809578 [Dendrothele bispora CBS 962.96]